MNGLDNTQKVRNSHWTFGSGIYSFIISETVYPLYGMSNNSLFLRMGQTVFMAVCGGA